MQNNIKKTTENLRMTIVPDITTNAALNGMSFDATLTDDVQKWLNGLKQTWASCKFNALNISCKHVIYFSLFLISFHIVKKGVITSNALKQFYRSRTNPYIDALKLYANLNTSHHSHKTNNLSHVGKSNIWNFTHCYAILCSLI